MVVGTVTFGVATCTMPPFASIDSRTNGVGVRPALRGDQRAFLGCICDGDLAVEDAAEVERADQQEAHHGGYESKFNERLPARVPAMPKFRSMDDQDVDPR